MSYSSYHFMHISSILILFMCLASMATVRLINPQEAWPKWMGITHGLSLLVILVGGFGMLARLGITGGLPPWIYIKLVIWLILGGIIAFIKKMPEKAQGLWIIIAILGMISVYAVSYKV